MSEIPKWEPVVGSASDWHRSELSRIEVPGGWLYLFEHCGPDGPPCCALEFVPKPAARGAKVRRRKRAAPGKQPGGQEP